MEPQKNELIILTLQTQLHAVDVGIEFALLFGSYASRSTSALSDIDVGIYFTEEPNFFTIGLIVARLEAETGKKVDLVILNGLSRKRPLLSYNITNNHIPIIMNNQEKYTDFKTESLHSYLDFKPVLNIQDKALNERISLGTYGKIQTA